MGDEAKARPPGRRTPRRHPAPEHIFTPVHTLLRRRPVRAALGSLLDNDGDLRPAYRCDANHAWYVVGDAWYRLGDMHRAREGFRRSLATRPDDTEAVMALADCWFAQGKLGRARYWFSRAFDASCSATAGYNLANVLFDLDDLDAAIAIYASLRTNDATLAKAIRHNMQLARRNREGRARIAGVPKALDRMTRRDSAARTA